MADRFGNDEPAPGPSQPPILGTDNTPWMTAEQIQAALTPPASGDRGPGGGLAPIDMNVNQFLSLDRPTQNQILATWGSMGMQMPIVPGDPNDPATPGRPLWKSCSSRARSAVSSVSSGRVTSG
jgi:hypothetical protein